MATKAAKVSAKKVAELRKRTGAGLMECKKALQECGTDMQKAEEWLRTRGITKAAKRAGRSAREGLIGDYVHFNGKVGVLVEVNCETDFVARTDDFQNLVKDVAIHIASSNPLAVSADDLPEDWMAKERRIIEQQVAESDKPEAVQQKMIEGKLTKIRREHALLEQPFVKDDKQTVGDLVKSVSGKVGEHIVIRRFKRMELGEE